VACPANRKEVFVVNQNSVNLYNTFSRSTSQPFKDLAFTPTSMTAGCGYIAAGGQRSQLIVRNLSSNWYGQTTVGGSINNALNISNHLDETRILVCNNDETIKVFSLPSLNRVTSIQFPTAANYAAVSPDGRRMVAVGDSNQVCLYDISAAAGYRKIASMHSMNDAGFSCSWNQNSDKFAVACQDGFVCVWDVRSSEKLAILGSKQNPQIKGACRNVKFSQGGSVDLLMYSEHVSYINVVDARTFLRRQAIRVAPPNTDNHISGIAWSPDAQSIFVGTENHIMEFDVDTTSRRAFPTGAII